MRRPWDDDDTVSGLLSRDEPGPVSGEQTGFLFLPMQYLFDGESSFFDRRVADHGEYH